MKKARISELRERITFQQRTRTFDEFGGFEETWSNLWTQWARITPLSKNVSENDSALIQTGLKSEKASLSEVTTRANPAIIKSMRFKWKNKIFKILDEPKTDSVQEFMKFIASN